MRYLRLEEVIRSSIVEEQWVRGRKIAEQALVQEHEGVFSKNGWLCGLEDGLLDLLDARGVDGRCCCYLGLGDLGRADLLHLRLVMGALSLTLAARVACLDNTTLAVLELLGLGHLSSDASLGLRC